jgi:hypothetical protein
LLHFSARLKPGPDTCFVAGCGVVVLAASSNASAAAFTSSGCAEWLEGRLPRPIDDPEQWKIEEE